MTAWCPKCGAIVAQGSPSCPRCGKKLSSPGPTGNGLTREELRMVTLETFKILLVPILIAIILGIACILILR